MPKHSQDLAVCFDHVCHFGCALALHDALLTLPSLHACLGHLKNCAFCPFALQELEQPSKLFVSEAL